MHVREMTQSDFNIVITSFPRCHLYQRCDSHACMHAWGTLNFSVLDDHQNLYKVKSDNYYTLKSEFKVEKYTQSRFIIFPMTTLGACAKQESLHVAVKIMCCYEYSENLHIHVHSYMQVCLCICITCMLCVYIVCILCLNLLM